jgi:hypothetical protein
MFKKKVAQLFFSQVYKLHGLPKMIISDQDKIFTSALWQELFRVDDEFKLSLANGWTN